MREFWQGILNQLQDIFDAAAIGAAVADYLSRIVIGLAVFLVVYLLWSLVRRLVRPVLARTRLDETATTFVMTILKYAILTIGAVNALAAAGINTASVLASLGIAGLTIGFAARDAFSNIISGILIFMDRPFVIGDLVEIDDNYGRVSQITLRSTRIITRDGKMLAVPNSDIINKTVASYTNFPHLRLDIDVTVGVSEDIGRVRRLLLGIVETNPAFLQTPAPRVVVVALNDYNVALQLQAWIADERAHVEMRFELREQVFETLNQAGVDMPFETLQIRPLDVNLQPA
ncbi:MAG: mechanosensitive ion channel family protein [Anaerolineales bacterium]|nr:mechanosensitive ion channel family protein [Anaerolineales bacterium]